MGIAYAKFLPEVVLDLPAKGRVDGAVRGAGQGFLAWAELPLRVGAEMMRGCSGEACGYLAIGVLAVTAATGTVGALIGGVQGAIQAIPEKEARRIEQATTYLADLKIQETMWSRTLDAAMDQPGYYAFAVPEGGPAASDCVVDYGGVAAPGTDAIVEVSVLSVGFVGETWGRNPPLSVFLQVRARRYRTTDDRMELVDESEFRYRSSARHFSEWMADGAIRVEGEFQQGYGLLAVRIAGWIGQAAAAQPAGVGETDGLGLPAPETTTFSVPDRFDTYMASSAAFTSPSVSSACSGKEATPVHTETSGASMGWDPVAATIRPIISRPQFTPISPRSRSATTAAWADVASGRMTANSSPPYRHGMSSS